MVRRPQHRPGHAGRRRHRLRREGRDHRRAGRRDPPRARRRARAGPEGPPRRDGRPAPPAGGREGTARGGRAPVQGQGRVHPGPLPRAAHAAHRHLRRACACSSEAASAPTRSPWSRARCAGPASWSSWSRASSWSGTGPSIQGVAYPLEAIRAASERLGDRADEVDVPAEAWPGISQRYLERVTYDLLSNAVHHGSAPDRDRGVPGERRRPPHRAATTAAGRRHPSTSRPSSSRTCPRRARAAGSGSGCSSPLGCVRRPAAS